MNSITLDVNTKRMNQEISLQGYMDENGKFDRLPGKKQKKKLDEMLKVLASQFRIGEKYSEKEVNEILNQKHSFNDPATLRRLLFGTNLLDRTIDGRSYWVKSKATI